MPLPPVFDSLPPAARSILHEAIEAAEARGLRPDAKPVGGYVRLSPHPNYTVAVYVHPTEFSIALDKDVADQICRTHATFAFEDKNPTGYVHVPYPAAEAARAVVLGIIGDALARSAAAGERTFPAHHTVHQQEPVALCPIHHLALAANGRCDFCE